MQHCSNGSVNATPSKVLRGITDMFPYPQLLWQCMRLVVSIVEALQIDIRDVAKGNYVACIYDKKVWYGIVNDISEESGDLLIKFMHPSGHYEQVCLPRSR